MLLLLLLLRYNDDYYYYYYYSDSYSLLRLLLLLLPLLRRAYHYDVPPLPRRGRRRRRRLLLLLLQRRLLLTVTTTTTANNHDEQQRLLPTPSTKNHDATRYFNALLACLHRLLHRSWQQTIVVDFDKQGPNRGIIWLEDKGISHCRYRWTAAKYFLILLLLCFGSICIRRTYSTIHFDFLCDGCLLWGPNS